MTKYDPEYFKEKFPNLFEELENDDTQKVEIDAVRTDNEEGERAAKPERNKGPTVVDFLRLCEDEDEALEIVNHMEKEGKIDEEHARDLRRQLMEEGVRSFGSKREPGKYSFTD